MFDNFVALSFGLLVLAFLAILGSLEIGRRLGRRRFARDPESLRIGTATVEGAVFGLMGLLIAFAFSGAMQRWDTRRALVVEETNAIGTAWLRIDLLAPESQPQLRDLFRKYLDSRLEIYDLLPDVELAREELGKSQALQNDIWSYSAAECLKPESEKARMLLIPAVNAMIDITTNRTMALLSHPPAVIFALLLALVLSSSLIAGFAMSPARQRSWMHMLCFAGAMSLGLYVIVDLEFPRAGLIRIEWADRLLVDLRASMK